MVLQKVYETTRPRSRPSTSGPRTALWTYRSPGTRPTLTLACGRGAGPTTVEDPWLHPHTSHPYWPNETDGGQRWQHSAGRAWSGQGRTGPPSACLPTPRTRLAGGSVPAPPTAGAAGLRVRGPVTGARGVDPLGDDRRGHPGRRVSLRAAANEAAALRQGQGAAGAGARARDTLPQEVEPGVHAKSGWRRRVGRRVGRRQLQRRPPGGRQLGGQHLALGNGRGAGGGDGVTLGLSYKKKSGPMPACLPPLHPTG